ncbi:MAG TPA: ABC-2 transporter permease [Candidatus Faecimonas gallistercoris]|nr:ABC-2 transporter permease [Candidatus Faecimonas gallistercoris]
MIGLVKKDLLVIKSNLKIILAVLVALLLLISQEGGSSAIFILPIIGVMMFISTFSYDEFNNWNSYVVTLPNGRRNAIIAKYIATIIIIVILSLVSIITTTGFNYIMNGTINMTETTTALLGTILSTSILVALLYPIMIQYGALNGRIIIFIVVIGIGVIGAILSKYVDVNNLINQINSLESYGSILVPIISIILLGISYFISKKLFQKKEF